jgi:hypothetical protein
MDQPNSRLAPRLIAAGMLALAVYPLSIGPAWWVLTDGRMSEGAFVAVYRPLLIACETWPSVSRITSWYMSLWGPIREPDPEPTQDSPSPGSYGRSFHHQRHCPPGSTHVG